MHMSATVSHNSKEESTLRGLFFFPGLHNPKIKQDLLSKFLVFYQKAKQRDIGCIVDWIVDDEFSIYTHATTMQ